MKLTKTYAQWLKQLKSRVRAAQIKAALKVNAELLELYWDLGKAIAEKEKEAKWGGGLIEQLSRDLTREFPEIRGFSRTNLFYIRKWYLFYSGSSQIVPQVVGQFEKNKRKSSYASKAKRASVEPIVPQVVGQIPWGHHREIITQCTQVKEALFYIYQTIQHNWSRSVLVHQLETNLYKRKGKALTNFALTLPKQQSDHANELLKNPYHFEFLQLGEKATEKDLETALTDQLVKFLLELGAGFAYINRQHLLVVDGEDFFIDLLFYHTRLHCYVVVELKMDNFKPEYAGKLNFYLAAVDAQLKIPQDQPSIGLLLCKKAGKFIVEYSLKNISTPIGVSEYKLTETIPTSLKGKLPSTQQIEKGLKRGKSNK
ncbi:MAG: PDDEXK nuclease domain-containing protein [Agriterribacter sp.]